MEAMPVIPFLIIGCVAVYILSIGRVEEILSLVPWVKVQFEAIGIPVYHAALYKKLCIISERAKKKGGTPVAPYRMSLVNNAKHSLCFLLFLFSQCVLLCIAFASAGPAKFIEYHGVFIFFFVAGIILAFGVFFVYLRYRGQIQAHKALKSLEYVAYFQGTATPPQYDEMAQTLELLGRISPPAFMHDQALYCMDRAYRLALAHRFAEALELVGTIDKRRLEEYSAEEADPSYEGYFSPVCKHFGDQLESLGVEMFERSLSICARMLG
jgi:hypothetical protein